MITVRSVFEIMNIYSSVLISLNMQLVLIRLKSLILMILNELINLQLF